MRGKVGARRGWGAIRIFRHGWARMGHGWGEGGKWREVELGGIVGSLFFIREIRVIRGEKTAAVGAWRGILFFATDGHGWDTDGEKEVWGRDGRMLGVCWVKRFKLYLSDVFVLSVVKLWWGA